MDQPGGPRREEPTAVVLVGGRGTRLASVVTDVPKPLVPVAGRPFLDWVAAWLADQGVADTVYAAGHLGDHVAAWLRGLRLPAGHRATYRQEPSPLGTGGAVLGCLDLCSDLVLIVNGDTLLVTDLAPIIEAVASGGLDGAIVAVEVADASRFGTIEADDHGWLRSIREKQPGAGPVNSGLLLLRKRLLERFLPARSMSLEADIVPSLVRDGARIRVVVVDRPFLDIGVPDALASADAFVEAHLSPATEP